MAWHRGLRRKALQRELVGRRRLEWQRGQVMNKSQIASAVSGDDAVINFAEDEEGRGAAAPKL
jgi:hypothetical protein